MVHYNIRTTTGKKKVENENSKKKTLTQLRIVEALFPVAICS